MHDITMFNEFDFVESFSQQKKHGKSRALKNYVITKHEKNTIV